MVRYTREVKSVRTSSLEEIGDDFDSWLPFQLCVADMQNNTKCPSPHAVESSYSQRQARVTSTATGTSPCSTPELEEDIASACRIASTANGNTSSFSTFVQNSVRGHPDDNTGHTQIAKGATCQNSTFDVRLNVLSCVSWQPGRNCGWREPCSEYSGLVGV